MTNIAIVTDRGCDLPPEQRQSHDVTVVPLIVRFGQEVVLDDGSLTADSFWERVAASRAHPETSQPSAGMFEEAFAPLVAAGKHVLCPLITGRMSGTVNAAFVAAQRFPGKVTVFDTRSLSLAQAFQVLAAALAAQQGRTLDGIVTMLESIRERSHMFIMLDTVEFLRRGGRAAKLMPVVDRVLRALRIRPLLRLGGGELHVMGAARSVSKAVQRLVDEVVKLAPVEAVAVAHTRRPQEAVELAATLAQRLGLAPEATLITEAGPALSAHAGPGVIAAAALRRAT